MCCTLLETVLLLLCAGVSHSLWRAGFIPARESHRVQAGLMVCQSFWWHPCIGRIGHGAGDWAWLRFPEEVGQMVNSVLGSMKARSLFLFGSCRQDTRVQRDCDKWRGGQTTEFCGATREQQHASKQFVCLFKEVAWLGPTARPCTICTTHLSSVLQPLLH